ncbi:hypothetical protein [Brumimicrobium aurantiacum]|uniref:Small multi-drug export protein n=1 Tax=Brumimicrobium aurantiacum TaxID=1737063 RepID=A0A3E1EW64_9FLAO|nr:hypothetical protein [Brumimicrobium aurantiacum]RFC53733.1 hypothetical protein DXU93_11440 [Brumimicrobium aurantiacum]
MWKYIGLAIFSTWKFMFAPLTGPAAGLSFMETFFSCLAGGFLSAAIFYFGSSYFMQLTVRRHANKVKRAAEKGKKIPVRRKFTKTNRRIIFIKQKIGMYAALWAFPLFLSIPVGTVITAKFYKHHRKTFPLILFFLMADCFLISSIAFYFTDFIS